MPKSCDLVYHPLLKLCIEENNFHSFYFPKWSQHELNKVIRELETGATQEMTQISDAMHV